MLLLFTFCYLCSVGLGRWPLALLSVGMGGRFEHDNMRPVFRTKFPPYEQEDSAYVYGPGAIKLDNLKSMRPISVKYIRLFSTLRARLGDQVANIGLQTQ